MIPTARWAPEEGAAQIASIVGEEHVQLRGNSVLAAPGETKQIAGVLRLAQENGLAVMATGGGTKLGWGHRVTPAIELSLRRLERLREHAWQDLTCTVEAGLRWQTMQTELARHGQMVCLDPLWPEQASVGGIVATNDNGALRFKYGGLRDLIIGMTVVLADGTIARTGGKVVKNVAGYDLHKLMTGSFGTLAVIAEVNFRLHPIEQRARTWTFSSPEAGTGASAFAEPLRALRDSHMTPSSVQMRASQGTCAVDVRFAGAPAHLEECALRIGKIFDGCVASESNHEVWGARQQLFEKRDCVVVKISALPNQVCSLCAELQDSGDVSIVAQAHGIVTAAIDPKDAESSIERLRARLSPAGGSAVVLQLPETLRAGIDVWGPVSGTLPLMQEIKRRFDPSRVLSPGRFWGNI